MAEKSRKILIIDDEEAMAELLEDYLRINGFTVSKALNAEDGIQMAEELQPDLILLDVMMPRIGGLDCLKMLKKVYAEAIVIMVSGVHDDGVAKKALSQGAYDYITKPIDFTYFKDNILSSIFPGME